MEEGKRIHTNIGPVPSLRFKGFEKAPILGKSVSDLLNDGKKITYGIVQPGVYDPDGVVMIRSQDYSNGWNDLSTMYKVSDAIDKPYQRSRVNKDDIIITVVGGNVGKLAVVPDYLDNSNISRSVARVSIQKKLAISKYVNLFLEKKMGKLIFLNQVGGAQPVLNLKELTEFVIPCPPLPEQQKIASFLSSVDEKIQQLTRKKELLEQYKKGVMQQLFSGKLRFKDEDGKAFPEWVEKRLGDVSIFLDGQRKPIKSQDRAEMKGPYPYYGASGIIDYVNEYIFDEDIILLGEDGENIVSRNLPLAFRVSGKCWVNNHAHVIRPNQNTDIDFLTYSLERINYVVYNTGTAQPKLNQAVCRNIPLLMPCTDEQKKIANYLSSIDNKIEILNKQITQTQTFKKGLLQQMFV